MLGQQRQLVALLLGGLGLGRRGAGLAPFGNEVLQAGIGRGEALDQRMLGRQRHERGAEQRIGTRREDLELPPSFSGKAVPEASVSCQKTRAPRLLPIQFACIRRTFSGQRASLSRAAQQLVGEVRDLEVPLGELAALDGGTGAPALTLDHLLVGQNGVVDGIPVDPGPSLR